MTQIFDEDGNITTVVGDTILFEINNVPTDLPYTIFFRVYDKDSNTIIPEVVVDADYNSTVTIEVKPYTTDTVIIPSGQKSVTYFYGIKACNFDNQVEHTQTVDGVDLNQETKITFLRKRVEGYYYYGTLYGWTNDGVTIYTISANPAANDYIYTYNGFKTTDQITSVTESGGVVTAITVNSTTYTKDTQSDDDDDSDSDSDSDGDSDTDTD